VGTGAAATDDLTKPCDLVGPEAWCWLRLLLLLLLLLLF